MDINWGVLIEKKIRRARAALLRTQARRTSALALIGERLDLAAQNERNLIADECGRALRRFADAVAASNTGIDKFNLSVPLEQLRRARLILDVEIRKLVESDSKSRPSGRPWF